MSSWLRFALLFVLRTVAASADEPDGVADLSSSRCRREDRANCACHVSGEPALVPCASLLRQEVAADSAAPVLGPEQLLRVLEQHPLEDERWRHAFLSLQRSDEGAVYLRQALRLLDHRPPREAGAVACALAADDAAARVLWEAGAASGDKAPLLRAAAFGCGTALTVEELFQSLGVDAARDSVLLEAIRGYLKAPERRALIEQALAGVAACDREPRGPRCAAHCAATGALGRYLQAVRRSAVLRRLRMEQAGVEELLFSYEAIDASARRTPELHSLLRATVAREQSFTPEALKPGLRHVLTEFAQHDSALEKLLRERRGSRFGLLRLAAAAAALLVIAALLRGRLWSLQKPAAWRRAEAKSSERVARAAALRYLGLPPQASRKEIERAYRRKARALHPDHSTGSSERFLELVTHYKLAVASSSESAPREGTAAWRSYFEVIVRRKP